MRPGENLGKKTERKWERQRREQKRRNKRREDWKAEKEEGGEHSYLFLFNKQGLMKCWFMLRRKEKEIKGRKGGRKRQKEGTTVNIHTQAFAQTRSEKRQKEGRKEGKRARQEATRGQRATKNWSSNFSIKGGIRAGGSRSRRLRNE